MMTAAQSRDGEHGSQSKQHFSCFHFRSPEKDETD
jgi:hypothetical protein